MLQPSLFDQQRENLQRVESQLAPVILRFIANNSSGFFHMADLTEFVRAEFPNCAPDSAGRILRSLRQSNRCNYRVANRRASLYQILSKS